MTRHLFLGPVLALILATAGPRADGQDVKTAPSTYKVAFWYQRCDPSSTLKSKAYDPRDPSYHPEVVDAWVKKVIAEFPAYVAVVRTIDLKDVPGASEDARLATAIERERQRIVAAHEAARPHRPATSPYVYRPQDLGKLLHPGGDSGASGLPGRRGLGPGGFGGPPGGSRPASSPSMPPFPYPYPRPHP